MASEALAPVESPPVFSTAHAFWSVLIANEKLELSAVSMDVSVVAVC